MKSKERYVAKGAELKLLTRLLDCYRSAYTYKQSLGLEELWSKCQDYWAGNVNLPVEDIDPGSETNIIQPIIESQVADIVNGDLDILVKGLGPSDQEFSVVVGQILRWVWYHNDMVNKLDNSERDRLNLGTIIWKVYWDNIAMSGKGLPTMLPLSPAELFVDPKITDVNFFQDADFMVQPTWYSRRKLLELFSEKAGDKVKLISPEGPGQSYDSRIFGEVDNSSTDEISNDQACLYEHWEKNEEGKMRRIFFTKEMILEDSDEDPDDKPSIPTEINKYPFVPILGYKRKGQLWGMGDTEQLIPIQDIINDLDDQIRMNARLTGNAQIVVGKSSGINIHKWGIIPGLRIPAKDHAAFTVVQPPYMPAYIPARREKAFYESELVSGRSEVLEGRRSGSLRAASAILALQEAGSRRANHKKLMLQTGFQAVINLVLDYVKEFMTIEQAFDITEKDKTEFLWFKGSSLNEIPELTLNEKYDKDKDTEEFGKYKQLLDENGKLMTKKAEFDIEVYLGAGMPNNKSFIYEAAVELHRENMITTEEARAVLKKVINWPIIDPWSPEGRFNGRNSSAEQIALANGDLLPSGTPEALAPASPPQPAQPSPSVVPQMPQIDPAIIDQLQAAIASGDEKMIFQVLQQLPPEILEQIKTSMMGGQPV